MAKQDNTNTIPTHEHTVTEGEVGFITKAKGYLLTLEGLPSVSVNDVIANEEGRRALVTSLAEDAIEALLLDRGDPKAGEKFMIHTRGLQFSFGEHLFGRVMNALGDTLDGREGILGQNAPLHLESQAPGMSVRAVMNKQLRTGLTAIDVLIPIAKGQRQLVVGPISSGKTVFLESVIAHQKEDKDTVCIYAFTGKPISYVEETVSQIFSEKGNKKTIILAAFSDDPAPIVYLTPAVAVALAEYFSTSGKDVVLVLDDLGSHAKYLREVALLSGRIPGRESYPGDMFYEHARLLEKAGYFNKVIGAGSITILPVIETNIEDITNLVPTNLMSATDGHLFFSPLLHAEGYFPSVVPHQSVTRVGRQTQSNVVKQLSIRVQALLAEYERQRDYSRFGTQLSEETRKVIHQGELLNVFLRQEPMTSISYEAQIILPSLVFTSLFNGKDAPFAERNREALEGVIQNNKSLQPIVTSIKRGTISFDQFLKKLEGVVPYFEAVCQQQ